MRKSCFVFALTVMLAAVLCVPQQIFINSADINNASTSFFFNSGNGALMYVSAAETENPDNSDPTDPNEPTDPTDTAETALLPMNLYYKEYDQAGTLLNSITISQENENNASGTYITRDAEYGRLALLSFNVPETFELVGEEIQLDFAPAVALDSEDEFIFSPTGEVFPDFELTNDYDVNFMWGCSGVGVYRLSLKGVVFPEPEEPSEDGTEQDETPAQEEPTDQTEPETPENSETPENPETPEGSGNPADTEDENSEDEDEPVEGVDYVLVEYQYFFVCKSGTTVLTPVFGSGGQAAANYYNDFKGDIILGFSAGENYQKPAGSIYRITDVQVDGAFSYQLTDGFAADELVIKKSTKIANGTYPVTVTVSHQYYEIDGDGRYTVKTSEPVTLTASLVFFTRPKDTGLADLLIGIAVLALLGAVLYGISYILKQTQERNDTVRIKNKYDK